MIVGAGFYYQVVDGVAIFFSPVSLPFTNAFFLAVHNDYNDIQQNRHSYLTRDNNRVTFPKRTKERCTRSVLSKYERIGWKSYIFEASV